MKTVMAEAEGLIYGDRNESYGLVTNNFGNIAKEWNIHLGDKLKEEITPEDVAYMMVRLKLARQMHQWKRDNLVDAIGYLGCVEKMEREKRKEAV